jgi:hypothetical protein
LLIRGFDKEESRKKHFKHATSDGMVSAYLGDRPGMKRVNSLPMCPKCERIGLRDKGWLEKMSMTCPHCGYRGPTDMVYSEYKKENKFL